MVKGVFPGRVWVLLVAFAVAGFSQTAQVTGKITDPSGSAVPNAKVVATNTNTGVARDTVTNEVGNYLITALLPGNYRITAEAPGFKEMIREPVTLEVDQVGRIDFTMEVGATRESVTVEASAVLLDAATSTVATLVEQRQVAELPLNGRDPIDLLGLTAGIRTQSGFGGVPGVGGTNPSATWSNFSFNGGLAGSNVVMVEGLALDVAQMNWPSYIPPVDATQEFRVQTNKFSAEYGRTSGAVVNFSIKSGTNQFHGGLYEYFRNRDLNANNWFQNRAGNKRAPFNQNQFGGSVGGPIKKDKAFFFANVEEYRLAQGSPSITTVPTALQKAGNFSQTYTAAGTTVVIADPLTSRQVNGVWTRDAFPNNIIPPSRLSTVATNVAQVYPTPTLQGVQYTNVNNYSTLAGNNTSWHNVVGKFDYNLSSRWKIFGHYARMWANLANRDPYGYKVNLSQAQESDRHHASVSATAVFSPSLVGEFHTGYARMVQNSFPYALGFDVTTLGFPPAFANATQIQSFPYFNISGLGTIGGASSSGMTLTTCNSWGERASLTWVKGSHTIKWGIDYRVQQLNQLQNNSLEPQLYFTNQMTALNPLSLNANSGVPMASFMLGYVSTGSVAKSERLANQRQFLAVFVQDDWKITRKLTMNIGTDYSLEFPITERHNRKMWFDPTASLPVSQSLGFPVTGGFKFADNSTRAPYDLYKRQWGPRLGFAYQLFRRTVIRTGYGLFWIPAAINEVTGDHSAPAWAISTTMIATLDGGITPYNTLDNPFPNGITNPPGNSLGLNSLLGQNPSTNFRHFRPGYMQQWNFDIQQELGREMILEVTYSGSSGVGLPTGYATQINQVPDQYLGLGSALAQVVSNPFYPLAQSGLIPSNAAVLTQPTTTRAQLLRLYPQFGIVFDEGDDLAHSTYHSFQLQFKKRIGASLVSAAYTLSKSISNMENRLDTGNGGSGFEDWYNRRLNKAINVYDAPQRLVFNYTYELPFGKGHRFGSDTGKLNPVISGWQLSGIYTAQSGTPLALVTASNLTGNFTDITDVYGTYQCNCRPNNNGQSAKLTGAVKSRLNQYFNTSVFSQPPAYTYGNAARTLPDVRNQWLNNLDFTIAKNTRFGTDGKYNLQLRGEFFNGFNRTRFSSPGLTFGNATFGVISAAGNPRQVQIAAKLIF